MPNNIPVGKLNVRTKAVKSGKGRKIKRPTELQAISPIVQREDYSVVPGVGGDIPHANNTDPLLILPDSGHEKTMRVYDVDIVNPRLDANLNNRGYSWGDEEPGGSCPETFNGEWLWLPDADKTGDLLGFGSTGRSFNNQDGTRYKGLKGGGQVQSEYIKEFRQELREITRAHHEEPKPEIAQIPVEEFFKGKARIEPVNNHFQKISNPEPPKPKTAKDYRDEYWSNKLSSKTHPEMYAPVEAWIEWGKSKGSFVPRKVMAQGDQAIKEFLLKYAIK